MPALATIDEMNKTPPSRQWSPREDLVVRIISPELAAEKLCLPVDEIKARRKALGLGAFVASKHPQGRGAANFTRGKVKAK
jgi:hypothetical protein